MLQPSFNTVIEDSYRNKYFFYYSGTSVCCKEVSRDGVPRDTIIASQVSSNFLATIDLQDRIYVACQNSEKGIYIFQYVSGSWKVGQILSIPGSGNITLLSLFGFNGALHIIYAKQMAIANFYNIYHLFKPVSPESFHMNTSWRKFTIGEIYAEDPIGSYSAIISRDSVIHLVCEWFDGTNYLIDYYSFENPDEAWKKRTVTTLFKKDVALSLLHEEGIIHLLCYTYEDEASAIFYYTKKEGSGKDFEFSCLDKISTAAKVSPHFHTEGSVIYASWIHDNKFSQYSLGKDQKSWVKKIYSSIPANESIKQVDYIRNRKGRHWIIKNTYFNIDYKYNINLPYFKENITDEAGNAENAEKSIRNVDGDLVRYIPYLIEEVHTLSQMVKALNEKLEQLETKKVISSPKSTSYTLKTDAEPQRAHRDAVKLKKSNFKDQFLKSNNLLSRPEATAVFMGTGSLPNPNELDKKDKIEFAQNSPTVPKSTQTIAERKTEDTSENATTKLDPDSAISKDGNIFKKIGDFFK